MKLCKTFCDCSVLSLVLCVTANDFVCSCSFEIARKQNNWRKLACGDVDSIFLSFKIVPSTNRTAKYLPTATQVGGMSDPIQMSREIMPHVTRVYFLPVLSDRLSIGRIA